MKEGYVNQKKAINRKPKIKVKEIKVKSVLQKSNLPESDYCINPYIGCLHACIYCYARFMRRFTGHVNEKWGEFLDIKINAPEILRNQLRRKKVEGIVFLGSVTDIYQQMERKYRITRKILEILLEHDVSIAFQTKSDLVLRDLDILKKFSSCEVGFTIITTDENVKKVFEPYSSSIEKRINALKILHKEGIGTYVFIGPILPHLTNLESILDAVGEYVDGVMGEILNIRCGNWNDIETALRNNFPDLLPDYKKLVTNKHYWDEVEKELERLCKERGIPLLGFYRH